MTFHKHRAADPELSQVLALMQAAFAEMEGRIDPPSSIHDLDLPALRSACQTAEVWSLGDPIQAAAIFTPRPPALYLGKLAVTVEARRQGMARALIALAEDRARALGLTSLALQTRVELVENHAAFTAMGFERAGETTHPGYSRPTSITWHRAVSPNAPQSPVTDEGIN